MDIGKMYKRSETIELKSKVTSNLCKEMQNMNEEKIYYDSTDNIKLCGLLSFAYNVKKNSKKYQFRQNKKIIKYTWEVVEEKL